MFLHDRKTTSSQDLIFTCKDSFFFFNIYLFLAVLGRSCCEGFSLQQVGATPSSWHVGFSCGGFSGCRSWALGPLGFSGFGSWA